MTFDFEILFANSCSAQYSVSTLYFVYDLVQLINKNEPRLIGPFYVSYKIMKGYGRLNFMSLYVDNWKNLAVII